MIIAEEKERDNDFVTWGLASEELCCFLATLMHNELATLTLMPLRTSTRTCNPPLVENVSLSLEERLKAFCGVPMLIDAIDTKCPRLKSLEIRNMTSNGQFLLDEGSSLGDAFFKLLPRLTTLRLDCYQCDDWALMQIAAHATNLVYILTRHFIFFLLFINRASKISVCSKFDYLRPMFQTLALKHCPNCTTWNSSSLEMRT
jgi:hypothetical protein